MIESVARGCSRPMKTATHFILFVFLTRSFGVRSSDLCNWSSFSRKLYEESSSRMNKF